MTGPQAAASGGGATVPFVKMQGVGNDFVVVEEGAWPSGADWPRLAIRLCDRKFGIGADGLLVIGPSSVADIRMRMFNPDGTEDMCGNGLRCVVRYASARGPFPADALRVETLDGIHESLPAGPGRIAVTMGVPHFAPQMLPMRAPGARVLDFPIAVDGEELAVTVVNTGSTHTVVFVDELPDDERFFRLSPLIEYHELFPQRTSVMWTRLAEPGDEPDAPPAVELRIYERGAGETLGCGTGALAAAVAAIETRRLPGPTIDVRSKGGTLRTTWDSATPGSKLVLEGPAEIVFEGEISPV